MYIYICIYIYIYIYIYEISSLRVNRTQFRAVIGLLTGHNTLRRHLYLLGLLDSPLRSRCRMMEETLAHIFYESEALASLRHAYLGSFFLEPKDIQSISLGPSGALVKLQGSLDPTWGTKCRLQGLGASGPRGPEPLYIPSALSLHYCHCMSSSSPLLISLDAVLESLYRMSSCLISFY